jgi:hypothetical protein
MRTHAFRLRVKITIKRISVNEGWAYLDYCSSERVILLLVLQKDPHIRNDFLNLEYYLYQNNSNSKFYINFVLNSSCKQIMPTHLSKKYLI